MCCEWFNDLQNNKLKLEDIISQLIQISCELMKMGIDLGILHDTKLW